MRKRSVGINVRVSVTEKKKVTMLARKCGLSLSEYLRQRALGYEPGGHPPKEVFDVLDKLDEIAEGCTPATCAEIGTCADRLREASMGKVLPPGNPLPILRGQPRTPVRPQAHEKTPRWNQRPRQRH